MLFFGQKILKMVVCGSKINLVNSNLFNHKANIIGGIMEKECSDIVKKILKNLEKVNKI